MPRPTHPYIRIARGFAYLVAVIDWSPGRILVAPLEHDGRQLLHRGAQRSVGPVGTPEIFNTDQGSQFTCEDFSARSERDQHQHGRPRPGDGQRLRGAAVASLKYEDVYLKGYADGHEAKAGIAEWIAFYNIRARIRRWRDRTPMAVWRAASPARSATTRGYDAALGQRNSRCPHTHRRRNNSRQLDIHNGQNGATSTLSPGPSGPQGGVHFKDAKKKATAAHEHSELAHKLTTTAHGHSHK